MARFNVSGFVRKPDTKVSLALLIIFTCAITFTAYEIYAQTSIQEEVPVQYRVTAPYNPPPRPHKDGEVIVGRSYFTARLYILLNKDIMSMELYLDSTGECIHPEGANVTLEPRLSGNVPRVSAYKISTEGKSKEVNASASLITEEGRKYVYLTLPEGITGEAYDLYWQLIPPKTIQEGVDKYTIALKIKLILRYLDGSREEYELPPKVINIIRPPVMNYIIVASLAAAGFGLLILAGFLGFFRMFTTLDLIVIAVISAMQVIWVHVIGRLLVFPILNRIPLTYNFAVGDFPYILLLILAVMLIRKPGTVTMTLFIYNLASQIMGFYSFDPAWWAYPIAEGIVPDLWILLRGEAILTDRALFLKRHIPVEKLELAPKFGPLKYIDGFIIGFARGFTMQYTLYTVFFPYFYRLSYSMGYVFWWVVLPWSIGNAIEAIISVPICEDIRKSAATI